jgi:MSHA biogenesis protein MshO
MRAIARNSALFTAGFTLMELVVTLVILGIVSAMVAVFLLKPIQGYFDTTRRARLVDAADFALRRIARDLATAVPNSVRSDATQQYMELLQSRSGGRYCNATDCGNPLLDADTTFSVIGPGVSFANLDSVVIGNLPSSGCDAYLTAPNRNLNSLNFAGSLPNLIQFTGPAFSSSCAEITKRFEIVVGPVTYACDSGATPPTLWRYSGYAIQAAQPVAIATLDALVATGVSGVPGVKAALATNVNCAQTSFDTSAKGEGLVELRIQLQDLSASGETVNLYRQVKVDNTP